MSLDDHACGDGSHGCSCDSGSGIVEDMARTKASRRQFIKGVIASGAAVSSAATLFGVGITFFWPTILGLTSEQCPRGGTLTLNAMGGIGMLAVGILGTPFLGYMQETSATQQLAATSPGLYQSVTVEKHYLLGAYRAIDPVKSAAVTDTAGLAALHDAATTGQFSALGKMAIFPAFTFACYVALLLYFKARGGYKAVSLGAPAKNSVK